MQEVTRVFIPYDIQKGDRQYVSLKFEGKVSRKVVKAEVRRYIKEAFGVNVPSYFVNHDCLYEWPSKDYVSMSSKMAVFNQWLDELHTEGQQELDNETTQAGGLSESEASPIETSGEQVRPLSDGFNGQAGRPVR